MMDPLDAMRSTLDLIAGVRIIAGVLLAVGVTYEFAADFLEMPFEKTIDDARRAETEAARTAIVEANARAAEATLETTRLRVKLADRSLTEEQKASIVDQLAMFAGTDFGVIFEPETAEGAAFARDISITLGAVGWRFERATLRLRTLSRGIRMEVDPKATDREVEAARVLLEILKGVDVFHEIAAPEGGRVGPPISASIRIVVGEKSAVT